MDGLLQLASTIFLTFGLGTLLYALVSYALKQMVGEDPKPVARPQAPAYPMQPQGPVYYGQTYPQGSYPSMPPQVQRHPPGYPMQAPWAPQGPAPRG